MNNYRGHPKGRIIEVAEQNYQGHKTLYALYNGHKKGIDYWGHREVEVTKTKEEGLWRSKKEKKKGRILEHKKGRTLVRTSQPVKILPVCSNGTETVVGISNRHLIMEVLEIVYLRLSRFCINAHAFILLRSLIFF